MGLAGVCHKRCGVARAAFHNAVRALAAAHLLCHVDNVEHGTPLLHAEVHNQALVVLLQVIERHAVTDREVVHVDVVAHARAIGRIVVVTEHEQFLALAEQRFHHHRDEVRRVLLETVDAALHVVARSVKIAERRKLDSAQLVVPLEEPLNGEFRVAVVIFGVGRMFLVDRLVLRGAVSSRGARKHEVLHAGSGSGIQNVDGARNVVHAVLLGIDHRLAGGLESGQVHEAFGLEIVQELANLFGVQNVALHESGFGEQVLLEPAAEVVKNADLVSAVQKFTRRVGSNVAGTADNCNLHVFSFFNRPLARTRQSNASPSVIKLAFRRRS